MNDIEIITNFLIEPKQIPYTQVLEYGTTPKFNDIIYNRGFQYFFVKSSPQYFSKKVHIILIDDFDNYTAPEQDKILISAIEHLEHRGILYLDSDNYERVRKISEESSFYIECIAFCGTIGKIFRKYTSFTWGVPRFSYTQRNIVTAIQKEAMKDCVYALAKDKDPILVIGGSPGEMPYHVTVDSVDIGGGTYKGKPVDEGGYKCRADRPMPIADNTYAIIESSHSLEHMENTEWTLKEWIRILKPGGILLIIVPDKEFHAHDMNPDKPLGERCFIEWVAKDFEECIQRIDNVDLLLFNTNKNKFDINIILRKKELS